MAETAPKAPYQVLARKYRPETFADLKGQDAMVRTLKNAFAADRIAHAFILTGIRGTGKTTTARIVAKGLNCVGRDGKGEPTTEPCGACEHCTAIAEGRHVDVLEMDAASRTGVGDIREIIEGVAYRAASARFKVYIIDEVHMLSVNAFNALLKTLEEPPEHVKFIFATTEIRKVPVTVLSRCQRFDLRRIEPEVMLDHLGGILKSEQAKVDPAALALIVRSAEGSARDAISLLDQAISHGAGETSAEQVRTMLGLADRGRMLDLFGKIMAGDAAGALAELAAQYSEGADPLSVLRDLAEITHWVSVVQLTPEAAEDPTISPDEKTRGQGFAAQLPMRALTRAWQMLLKAIEEVASAPNAMMAAEMAVIRLTHVADLPTPEDLVRRLQDSPPPTGGGGGGGGGDGGARGSSGSIAQGTGTTTGAAPKGTSVARGPGGAVAVAMAPEGALARFVRFDDVVELIRANRDVALLVEVENHIRLHRYLPGRIEIALAGNPAADFTQRLAGRLQGWTGVRWGIALVADQNVTTPTIAETRNKAEATLRAAAANHPLVRQVSKTFPGARIVAIRSAEVIAAEAAAEALPEVEGEWDPFEED